MENGHVQEHEHDKKHHNHQHHSHGDNNQGESGDNHTHGHAGHDHHRMMIEDFIRRFWISLFFTLPVLVLYPMFRGFSDLNGFSMKIPTSCSSYHRSSISMADGRF